MVHRTLIVAGLIIASPWLSPSALAIEIIAHRGLACASVENSLESIEAAWTAGADAVELDVRVSSDGIAYLFHDDELQDRNVDELSYVELAELSIQPLPTLAAALRDLPSNGYLVLDLKTDEPTAVEAIARVLRAVAVRENALSFQSTNLDALDTLGREFTDAKLTYLSRLEWRIPYLVRPDVDALAQRLDASGVHRVSIKGRSFVNARLVETLKANRRELHVWTINKPRRARYYRDIGVDGIITDDVPGLMSALGLTTEAPGCPPLQAAR